jgi:hypothetical protein
MHVPGAVLKRHGPTVEVREALAESLLNEQMRLIIDDRENVAAQ